MELPKKPKIISEELTVKGTIRKRKPKISNIYFTEETEDAIIAYLKSEDPIERNKIFNEKIDYAFNKLAENIIHTFKFYYMEVDTMAELRHEVVAFLISKLHLYQKSKGKAYSYFGTIAKRYLILYNEKNYTKLKDKAELDEVDEDKKVFNDIMNAEKSTDLVEFMDSFVGYINKHLYTLFPKPQDAKTADAILELFRKRENLDVFNKKALFIYTREIADVNTPQITKIIKKFKEIYKELFNIYYRDGYVNIEQLI